MDDYERPAPVSAAAGTGRRGLLEAIRDRLAAEMDGRAGHRRVCDCRCGVPPDARTVPTLAKELREIVRELDELPVVGGKSKLDELTAARQRRRGKAS